MTTDQLLKRAAQARHLSKVAALLRRAHDDPSAIVASTPETLDHAMRLWVDREQEALDAAAALLDAPTTDGGR